MVCKLVIFTSCLYRKRAPRHESCSAWVFPIIGEMAPLVSKKASVFVLHILNNMPTYVGSKYVLRLGTKVSTELIASLFVFVLSFILIPATLHIKSSLPFLLSILPVSLSYPSTDSWHTIGISIGRLVRSELLASAHYWIPMFPIL